MISDPMPFDCVLPLAYQLPIALPSTSTLSVLFVFIAGPYPPHDLQILNRREDWVGIFWEVSSHTLRNESAALSRLFQHSFASYLSGKEVSNFLSKWYFFNTESIKGPAPDLIVFYPGKTAVHP